MPGEARRAGGACASRRLQRGLDDAARRSRATTRSARRASSGAVGDQEDRAPLAEPLDRLADELGARRVEVRRRLVEDQRAARRAGRRARARAAAARRPRAVGRRRRPSCRSPSGRSADEAVGAGELRGLAARDGRRRVGSPSRMLSATVPRKSVGRCGTQAICVRQAAASQAARSTLPRAGGRASGSARRRSSEAIVLLPAPLVADERDRLARRELEVDAVEHEPPARRVGERDALEPDGSDARARRASRARWRAAARSSRRSRRRPRRRGRRRSRGTAPRGSGAAGRARARARAPSAPASKPSPPSTSRTPTVTATSAIPSVAASSSTAPERNATRSVPIVARRYSSPTSRDPLGLRRAAVERAQRRQPADDVEEVGRETRSACQRSRVRRSVYRPTSHMKTGTSGSVSSMTPAETGSIAATRTSTATGTTTASTTCGR